MTLKKLAKLWRMGRDIPVTEDGIYIDQKWYIWKKGTEVLKIWHWFDNELYKINPNYTLHDLMYGYIKEEVNV